MLNLALLAETKRPVVHCKEKWQATALICEFDKLSPGEINLNIINWWDYYKDKTCYYTDIRVRNGGLEHVRFEYCSDEWYTKNGYKVLEFDDIVFTAVDLGEFSTDLANINNLFDVG